MTDSPSKRMEFEDYKKLNSDLREFYMFEQLCDIKEKVCGNEKKYAAKWVETTMKLGIGTVMTGFFATLVSAVWHTNK